MTPCLVHSGPWDGGMMRIDVGHVAVLVLLILVLLALFSIKDEEVTTTTESPAEGDRDTEGSQVQPGD